HLFVQSARGHELVLCRLRATTGIARSARAIALVYGWAGRSRDDLHLVLARQERAAILAQRTQFRSVPESQSNRKSFWSRRDHRSRLRSGRSAQRSKALDILG